VAGKPSTTLLILCSTAVAAIYAGAYVYTEPTAGASIAAGQTLTSGTGAASSNTGAAKSASGSTSSTATTSKQSSSGSTSSTSGSTSGSTSSSSSNTSKSATNAKPAYKDGVFTGSGTNLYGQLSVAVTIAAGKITNVKITSYAMHYPSWYISPYMNKEVVKMQTYQIYGVSGATASSYNFAEAVYYALKAAKA